jgi:hypothetical protein
MERNVRKVNRRAGPLEETNKQYINLIILQRGITNHHWQLLSTSDLSTADAL